MSYIQKKRGQRPAVDDDTVINALKDKKIFDENGNLKKSKETVWSEVVVSFKVKVNPVSLYLRVNRNDNGILDKLQIDHGILKPIEKKKKNVKKVEVAVKEDLFQFFQDFLDLKIDPRYSKTIRKFGCVPFILLYSSTQQIDLWKMISKASSLFLVFVNKVGNNENLSFYALASEINDEVIPFIQCLTDEPYVEYFESFLRESLSYNLKAPKEIVVGYLVDLIDRTSIAFNECSLDKYNEMCFNNIRLQTSTEHHRNNPLPKVLIRVDKLEFLKVIDDWDCLSDKNLKKFFMCCVILLTEIESFDLFKETACNIMMLFINPCNDLEITKFKDELVTKKLKGRISHYYNQLNQKWSAKNFSRTFGSSFFKVMNPMQRKDTHVSEFVTQLEKDARNGLKCENLLNSNQCYNKRVAEKFSELLLDFPVWSKLVSYKNEINVTENSSKFLDSLEKNFDETSLNFFTSHCAILEKKFSVIGSGLSSQDQNMGKNDYPYLKKQENWRNKVKKSEDFIHLQQSYFNGKHHPNFPEIKYLIPMTNLTFQILTTSVKISSFIHSRRILLV